MSCKPILLSILGIIPLFCFAQTCVIAKQTKRAIYVAADSRTVLYSQNKETGKLYSDTGSVCKIYHTGNTNFALIGAYFNEAKNIAFEECKNRTSFDTIVKEYAMLFNSMLQTKLTALLQQNRAAFNAVITANNPFVSQIIFFGIDNDSLIEKHIAFKVELEGSTSSQITIRIRHLFGSFNPDAAGHIEEITDTLHTKNVFKKGVVKTMKYLIHNEATLHPMEVGGDIDIIKVTRRKTKWIQKKSSC